MKSEQEIRERLDELRDGVSEGVDPDRMLIEELEWVLEDSTDPDKET